MLIHLFEPEAIVETTALMAVAYIVVLFAVGIDTATGVQKAHRKGRKIQSSILRRVFAKLLVYYGLIIMFTLGDILLFISDLELMLSIPELPYLTIIGCVGAVATEGWSVWENMPRHDTTSIKQSVKQTQELARAIAKAVEEIKHEVPINNQ